MICYMSQASSPEVAFPSVQHIQVTSTLLWILLKAPQLEDSRQSRGIFSTGREQGGVEYLCLF